MNNENQNARYTFSLSTKEIEGLFKFLSRVDLKGLEVPEFNNIISLFKINKEYTPEKNDK